MGFHVSEGKPFDGYEPDLKFYINANVDTYKFARLYYEECKKNNMDFYFKVVNPEHGEECRSDKLCIYSSYRNAEKNLKIIKKIKREHPEFVYESPGLLIGTIDNSNSRGEIKQISNTVLKKAIDDSEALHKISKKKENYAYGGFSK